MAFETTICDECPSPIHWQKLRKHYLFLINTALDVRDKKLKEQDKVIAALRAEVKAWRDAEIDERKWRALDKARAATDATKALEES